MKTKKVFDSNVAILLSNIGLVTKQSADENISIFTKIKLQKALYYLWDKLSIDTYKKPSTLLHSQGEQGLVKLESELEEFKKRTNWRFESRM